MDLPILGLTVSSVNAMGAILPAISFSLNRGKVAKRSDQLACALERGQRSLLQDHVCVADYLAAIAADIAIVKTLAETNIAALASAENRLAAAIEQMNTRFGELNQRIDAFSTGESRRVLRILALTYKYACPLS